AVANRAGCAFVLSGKVVAVSIIKSITYTNIFRALPDGASGWRAVFTDNNCQNSLAENCRVVGDASSGGPAALSSGFNKPHMVAADCSSCETETDGPCAGRASLCRSPREGEFGVPPYCQNVPLRWPRKGSMR